MKQDLVLIGADLDRLVGLSLGVGARAFEVTLLRSEEALVDAVNYPGRPGVMLVSLAGHENVADIRALLASRPDTGFLLLTPDHPPSAAVARIARSYGDVILPDDDPEVVVVATLIALAAKRRDARARHA